MRYLPRGTTAGAVLEQEGVLAVADIAPHGVELLQRRVVNVNNRLVDETTPL